MKAGLSIKTSSHVIDILGNVIGRDQPIMLVDQALQLVSLLGEDNFKNDSIAFFDPFCKAGEILLACALSSCWTKINGNKKLLDIKYVQEELYKSNRYFGLAPDERHYRLSLRTFLGNTHSHDKEFNQIIQDARYLSELDGRFNQANFEKELHLMLEHIRTTAKKNKIIVVGNPPYQESDGGAQASAKPIYNYFVDALIASSYVDEFVLVIPARWFSAGKGLEKFRNRMMNCHQIKTIKYFEKAEEVFPTVQIKGGICFLHYDSNYNANPNFIFKDKSIDINLSQYDIIPDDPFAASIINKIVSGSKLTGFVSSIAWSAKPFGLRTFHFQRLKNKIDPELLENPIKCYTTRRVIEYIDKDEIIKNHEKIGHYKVVAPRAYGKGMSRCTLPKSQFFILGPGEISTETYNVIGCFTKKTEALNFKNYLQTDFARYLLGLRKLTQDIPKDRWKWVPQVDLNIDWDDSALAKHFNLTKAEQLHIKKKIMEWF